MEGLDIHLQCGKVMNSTFKCFPSVVAKVLQLTGSLHYR